MINKLAKPAPALVRQRASSRNLALLTSQAQRRSREEKSVVPVLLCWRKASPSWLRVRISLQLPFWPMTNAEGEHQKNSASRVSSVMIGVHMAHAAGAGTGVLWGVTTPGCHHTWVPSYPVCGMALQQPWPSRASPCQPKHMILMANLHILSPRGIYYPAFFTFTVPNILSFREKVRQLPCSNAVVFLLSFILRILFRDLG